MTKKIWFKNLITKWDMDCPRQTKIVLWYVQKSMIQVRSQVNNFFWIEIAKYYNKPFLVWVGKKGFCSSKVAMVQPIPYCTNVVLSRSCTGCYTKICHTSEILPKMIKWGPLCTTDLFQNKSVAYFNPNLRIYLIFFSWKIRSLVAHFLLKWFFL